MINPEEKERVDNSLEALLSRLSLLQEPLGQVVAKAVVLFDEIFEFAPHPGFIDKDFPVYGTRAMGVETGGELTVKLPESEWIRVFRFPEYLAGYPTTMIWHNMPNGKLWRQVNIKEKPNSYDPRLTIDIETSDYDGNRHAGFVDSGYNDQESFIEGASKALDTAREIAGENLDFSTMASVEAERQRLEVNSKVVTALPYIAVEGIAY